MSQIGNIGLFKVIPPKNWVARKEGYDKLQFHVKKPIEQNVQKTGTHGVYELTLIEQMSRSMERFRQEAERFSRVIDGKTANEVERLVSRRVFNKFNSKILIH